MGIFFSSLFANTSMPGNNLENPVVQEPWEHVQPCIYKIEADIRSIKPKAYTPQKILIGPLHNDEVRQAYERTESTTTPTNVREYVKWAEFKFVYQAAFEERVVQDDTINIFKADIMANERRIRANYFDSGLTVWIRHQEFVDMIYRDSVFILEFILRTLPRTPRMPNDPLTDPLLREEIKKDLMLLENQLPFFILERLFNLSCTRLGLGHQTFQLIVTSCFGGGSKTVGGEIKHFTDLLRRMYVDTLVSLNLAANPVLQPIYDADKLKSGGVKFVAGNDELSLVVKYDNNGRLEIPPFTVDEITELKLRNIMALEKNHYPNESYVRNHVMFLDNLINNARDVDLFVENGIIMRTDDSATIAETVNNLKPKVVKPVSYLADIAVAVNSYHDKQVRKRGRLIPILKRTYFYNLWAITAFIVAAVIVLSTVGAFIVAIIEAKKK